MTEVEKHIGESKMSESPRKALSFKLGEDVVDTKHIKNKSVTAEKLSDGIVDGLVEIATEKVLDNIAGKVVLNSFGNSETQAMSQKILTDSINDIYAKLREMNGEPPIGLYVTATPEYFIGEEGANLHIEAITTSGIFEHIAFYLNDVQIPGAEAENVYRLQCDVNISQTAVIKCRATIMGIDYTVEKVITHYSSFWLGAGATYRDVMNVEHNIPVEGIIRGAYDIACSEGDHIIIILGDTLKSAFIRADMNGFEIPFNIEKITLNGSDYWVYTSENTYIAGTYNIDING